MSSEQLSPPGKLREILKNPDKQQEIVLADVLLGLDAHNPASRELFFGRAVMERIAATGNVENALIVTHPIDFDTDDPEVLAEVCNSLKGSCCYKGVRLVTDKTVL